MPFCSIGHSFYAQTGHADSQVTLAPRVFEEEANARRWPFKPKQLTASELRRSIVAQWGCVASCPPSLSSSVIADSIACFRYAQGSEPHRRASAIGHSLEREEAFVSEGDHTANGGLRMGLVALYLRLYMPRLAAMPSWFTKSQISPWDIDRDVLPPLAFSQLQREFLSPASAATAMITQLRHPAAVTHHLRELRFLSLGA